LHPFLGSYLQCCQPSDLSQQQQQQGSGLPHPQQQQQQLQLAGRTVLGCAPHTIPALLLPSGRLREWGWLHYHPHHLALLQLMQPLLLLLLYCCCQRAIQPQQPLQQQQPCQPQGCAVLPLLLPQLLLLVAVGWPGAAADAATCEPHRLLLNSSCLQGSTHKCRVQELQQTFHSGLAAAVAAGGRHLTVVV
jgi:hypothetical protein